MNVCGCLLTLFFCHCVHGEVGVFCSLHPACRDQKRNADVLVMWTTHFSCTQVTDITQCHHHLLYTGYRYHSVSPSSSVHWVQISVSPSSSVHWVQISVSVTIVFCTLSTDITQCHHHFPFTPGRGSVHVSPAHRPWTYAQVHDTDTVR